MRGSSRLEHCPSCESVNMKNYVHIETGKDTEVFVECADCGAFVARYGLKHYTSDDAYASYIRLMHTRRMASGTATSKAIDHFREELLKNYRKVKEEVSTREDPRSIDEIISTI